MAPFSKLAFITATFLVTTFAIPSAWATEPPTVPRLRIAACPTWDTASVSSGHPATTAAERCRVAWRVNAPIRRLPCEMSR